MKRLLIGLGILFALAAGVQFFWSRDLRAEWEARLDKLRAAGEVVDYADLEPPPVPHDRNAAPVLLEAQQAYRQAPGEPWLLHGFERSEWTDEIWEEARVFFAARESYARLLEQAAAMPDCWFDMDFSDPIRMRVPLFRIIMDANSFLQYRAVLEARDGEPVRAARSLLLMMDTGNRLDRNTLISYLVRLVNQGIAARTLQELAAQPGFRAREVRALLEPRFARCEDPDGLQIALRAERAAAIWYIRFLLDGGDVSELFGGDRNPVNRASAPLMRPLIYKGGIEYLDAMETALPLMTEPFWESLGPAGEIADRLADHKIAGLLVALIPKGLRARADHAAWIRLARIGLALLEHREETGAFPDRLDGIAARFPDGIPTDPFTGGPFLYRRGAEGARLAAAVPIRSEQEDRRDELEIVWRLPGGP